MPPRLHVLFVVILASGWSCYGKSVIDCGGKICATVQRNHNGIRQARDNSLEEERLALLKELVGDLKGQNTSSVWGAYKEVKDYFPFFKIGYDHDGLAVYVAEFGRWDFAGMAEKPQKFQDDFWKYSEKQFQLIDLDAKRNNSQGVVLLVDYDGFGLRSFRSPAALQMALKVFNRVVRFNNSLKYGFIINLDFASEVFMNAARPLVGEILDKFETFGTMASKWKPALLRKIPSIQLPQKYGGSEKWRPPKIY